jgi:IS1 family transposase
VQNKRHELWIWKGLNSTPGQLLDWECGRRDQATLPKLGEGLVPWEVRYAHTACWRPEASVLPPDPLVQS